MPVLEARNLSISFQGFYAVKDVNFTLEEGTLSALIGPNGAGKTTLFNLFTKFLQPTRGSIFYQGEDVTALSPPAFARKGVGRSFQISAVFPGLTVRENIETALLRQYRLNRRWFGHASQSRPLVAETDRLLAQFDLEESADLAAAALPYGRKRELELATTIAMKPSVMLLDEPTAGLAHEAIDRVVDLIKMASVGRTILIVEHNMEVVAKLAAKVTVMVRGEILAEGPYSAISKHPDVIAAYTGGAHAQHA